MSTAERVGMFLMLAIIIIQLAMTGSELAYLKRVADNIDATTIESLNRQLRGR